jgi:NAD(P)-dependent dehydrogenase (short-subunit alcohol dehydrogenase family)
MKWVLLGAIINISSAVGLQGNIGQSVYSASKAAIVGMEDALKLYCSVVCNLIKVNGGDGATSSPHT